MLAGYFKVCRALWDDAAFADEQFSEREAWLWMIAEAAWASREVRRDRNVIKLDRGQLSHSVRFMAERWGWSKSRVDRFLKRLAGRNMIGTTRGTGFVIISISKYEEYQSSWGTGGTTPGQWRDVAGTNNKEINQLMVGGGSGGGGARARETVAKAVPPSDLADRTHRENLLAAMGSDNSGQTGTAARKIITDADMLAVRRWSDDLGLSKAEQISIVEEVMATKVDPDPPTSFRYFDKPMSRFAGHKADTSIKLEPIRSRHCGNDNVLPERLNDMLQRNPKK